MLPTPDELRAAVSAARWADLVKRAHARVRVMDAVADRVAAGFVDRAALAEVAPELHWSTRYDAPVAHRPAGRRRRAPSEPWGVN